MGSSLQLNKQGQLHSRQWLVTGQKTRMIMMGLRSRILVDEIHYDFEKVNYIKWNTINEYNTLNKY